LAAGVAVPIRCRQRPVRVEPENLRDGVAAHEMSVTTEQYPIEARQHAMDRGVGTGGLHYICGRAAATSFSQSAPHEKRDRGGGAAGARRHCASTAPCIGHGGLCYGNPLICSASWGTVRFRHRWVTASLVVMTSLGPPSRRFG